MFLATTLVKKNSIVSEDMEITVPVYFEAHRENSLRDIVKDYNLSHGRGSRENHCFLQI